MKSIISHGCFLRNCSIENSVVGLRSRLEDGVELKVSFGYSEHCSWIISTHELLFCRIPFSVVLTFTRLMQKGQSCWQMALRQLELARTPRFREWKIFNIFLYSQPPDVDCHYSKAIIDKNARIGQNVIIANTDVSFLFY